jgi:hypothetical protein
MFRPTALSVLLAITLSNLIGCERHIVYCEGPRVSSPDGQCNAQRVQDVATNGAYAVVEYQDWHYPPYPDWNAVILNGPHTPLTMAWLGNRSLEVTVPSAANIRNYQSTIRGRSYAVEVALRKAPHGDTAISGCGLDP